HFISHLCHVKKIFLFFLFCFCFTASHAGVDTNYVRRFSTKFYLRSFVTTNGFNYSIVSDHSPSFSGKELKDSRVKYLSYTPVSAGFAVNLFSVGISHSFQSSVQYLNSTNKIATYF